jgi:excisionase family DNA binding protein
MIDMKNVEVEEQYREIGRLVVELFQLLMSGTGRAPAILATAESTRQKPEGMPLAPRLLYTRAEAAWMLSISKASVQELVHRGVLREIQMGRRLLIHRDELERFGRQGAPDIWAPDGGRCRRRSA